MFNVICKSLVVTAILLIRELSNAHCYACLMCISKIRKKLRPGNTSPPLADMSLMLWINHKLRKNIITQQTNKICWTKCICLELFSWANWKQALVSYRRMSQWAIPQTGHAEFSVPCNGNCLTLGAGGMREISETGLGNRAVICHGQPQWCEAASKKDGIAGAVVQRTRTGGDEGYMRARKDEASWAN